MEINSKICKVCHCADSQDNPLCFPCKCNGSIKYIHKECLFLYIESSNKTFCTICKYKYILKDIFKPDTPAKVPFKLILKGIYNLLVKYLIKIGSNLLTLTILILIILVNGSLMLISSGSDLKYLFTSYFGILSVIFFGILTTFFSYLNFHFFKNLSAYLEQVLNRRVIRIDPLSAMNSIATDLISMTDSEIDGTARTLLSTITQRLRYEEEREAEEREEMPSITTRERVVNNQDNDPVVIQPNNEVIQPNDNTIDNEHSHDPLINNDHLIDNDPSSFTTSSEDSFITQSTPSSFTPINFYSILKGINISLIWWFVSKIYSFTSPFTSYFSYFIFLKDVYLDIITQKFLILYLLLFSLVGLLKIINPKSISFSIIKIYHLGILSLFFFIYFQGVCVHYAFSNILNNNLPVLSLESSYFKDYKTLLSLVFHLILGYSVTSLIKKTLALFKNKFRRGVLWFIVEPSNNDFTYLTQMASENPFTSIFRFLLRGITTLLLAKYIFYILRGANILILSITSVNKALLLFKLMDLVSEPFSVFNKQVANLINRVIYLISRILKLSNYLYGDVQKVDKSDLKRFKWLPNTHKYYKQSTVKRKFNKKVTVGDLEKYFNKKRVGDSEEVGVGNDSGRVDYEGDEGIRVHDDGSRVHDDGSRVVDEGSLTNNNPIINNTPITTDFSIFFTPSYFKLRLSLISFISLTLYVTFYFSLFRFSNYVGSFLQIEKFFNNSSDVILIVISGTILQGLRLILYLLKRNKNIIEDLISFTKSFILLVFSLVIWPLWSTFIILVLYSEPLRSIYPGRLISLLFSSSSIITFILNKVLFLRPIRNYSFSVIFKKLYGFISIMTFLIICISLLRSYSFIVIIETSEIPFLLIFGISALVFYLKHCIKVMYSSFIENIKREHYLVDRNVENYVSGE